MKKIRWWDRRKAIEEAQELERMQQQRASAFSHFLSDVCRFKLCILATYPTDPKNYKIEPTRFESFSNIRSDLHQDISQLRQLEIEIHPDIENAIDRASLYDFVNQEACARYFEELEAACRRIIMYY